MRPARHLKRRESDASFASTLLINPYFEVRGLQNTHIVFLLKRTHENYLIPRNGIGSEGQSCGTGAAPVVA